MKKINKEYNLARLINDSVFGVGGMILLLYVCVEWQRQGCGWWSLVAAIAFYGGCLFAMWFTIDQALQGK